MTSTPEEIRQAVQAAIDRLPCVEGSEHFADQLISSIIMLSQGQQLGAKPADLRKTGNTGVEKELKAMRLHGEKLRDILQGLHPQTRQRIWDAPSFVDDAGQHVTANIKDLLPVLEGSLTILLKVAQIAKPPKEEVRARGRTADLRSAAATKIAAFYYQRITASKPDRSQAFLSFLQSVFDALSIRRNVDRAARDYLTKLRT